MPRHLVLGPTMVACCVVSSCAVWRPAPLTRDWGKALGRQTWQRGASLGAAGGGRSSKTDLSYWVVGVVNGAIDARTREDVRTVQAIKSKDARS